jgi:hypothetical protein
MSNKSEDIWDQYAWGIRRPPRVNFPYYTRESKEAKFQYDCTVHGSSRGRLAGRLFVKRKFCGSVSF